MSQPWILSSFLVSLSDPNALPLEGVGRVGENKGRWRTGEIRPWPERGFAWATYPPVASVFSSSSGNEYCLSQGRWWGGGDREMPSGARITEGPRMLKPD